MSEGHQQRNIRILIGVGLVLVGLTTGILAMLVFQSDPVDRPFETRVVERVQLGALEPLAEIPLSDSGLVVEAFGLNRLFRQVADRVTPAVVYIQVEVPVGRDTARQWYHEFEGESRPRFFENPLRQSVGSGVLISNEGFIVTNYHVVENAANIQVTLADKRLYDARIVGTDPSTDLAVLKVEDGSAMPAIRFGNSDKLQVGEWVLAIGNPFRLTSTVTAGIISAIGRQVNIIDDSFRIEDFIQTDAAINPGNSGGALVNLNGELVGIATAIATESGSYEGYGFAVPVNLMERVVRDIIEHGEVRRGFLGVEIQDVDARVARRIGMDRIMGVYVNEVRSRGAAHVAGLQSGDVILSIDGRAVNASNELQSAIARHRPAETVDVAVWRRGRIMSFGVELLGRESPAYQDWFSDLRRDSQPPSEPRATPEDENIFEIGEWGIGLRDLTERERDAFDTKGGSYVAYVAGGSLADAAGLPRDVTIVSIAGEAVASTDEAIRLLEEVARFEETILLRVRRRDGVAAFYELEVPVPAG